MEYFSSSNVAVYPCANRGTNIETKTPYDTYSLLNTEYNTNNLGSNLAGKKSYIVDYSTTSKVLKVVIGGYYFEINDFSELDSDHQYLNICTKASGTKTEMLNTQTTSDDITLDQLIENEYRFTGLSYSSSAKTGTGYTSLQILTNTGTTAKPVYEIYEPSTFTNDYNKIQSSRSEDSVALPIAGNVTEGNGKNSIQQNDCVASGANSVALGQGTTAKAANETTVGQYNADVTNGLFVVGNGSSTSKSNAFYVDAGGNAKVTETITANNLSSGTETTSDNEKLKFLIQLANNLTVTD